MIQGRIVDAPTIKGTINATLLKGDKGDKGDTPQLSIGEVTTLEPNESATVQIADTVISFGIPRGVQGERGLQGIQGERGEQGFSITNVTDYYALSRSTNINPASLVFTTNVPTMTALDRYLWTYTRFTLGDGSTVQTNRHIISVYGDKGDQGVGVSHVVAHYQVCESPINAPEKWDRDRTLTPQNRYLWSYETFTFTNGSTVNTTPRLIGVYGDRGIKGDKGDTPAITTSKSGGQTTIMSDGVPVGTINDGHTPNISIGTVSTLDPDQPATATITGTAENPVLNLGIPQGEDGEIPDTQHFVRDTDYATASKAGLVRMDAIPSQRGINITSDGLINTIDADGSDILNGEGHHVLTPETQHLAVYYGLASAAGVHGNDAHGNDVGEYSDEAKAAIQNLLDVPSKADVAAIQTMSIHICTAQEYDSTTRVPTIQSPDAKTFYLVPTADGSSPDLFTEWVYVNNAWEMFGSASIDLSGYLTDVTVNGTSVVNNGVAEIPIGSSSEFGVFKTNYLYGIAPDNGVLQISGADESQIKTGTDARRPIVPNRQHQATFYGLAKAAGDTSQSQSNNAVGTYTNEAKSSIQSMLGVPSEDDVVNDVQINGASIVTNGVANIQTDYTQGIGINEQKKFIISYASDNEAKAGTAGNRKPITPSNQHVSTFYGLAKAAGDTTQSQSSNAVGTYTDDAKTAIKNMLGVEQAGISATDPNSDGNLIFGNSPYTLTTADKEEIAQQVEVPLTETVSGTTPTIVGLPNTSYICGEVTLLTVTPPASGMIDVIFESGTNPAVLTLPNTVKFPEWFDVTSLESNTVYEIMITNGIYGSVMSWPI